MVVWQRFRDCGLKYARVAGDLKCHRSDAQGESCDPRSSEAAHV